MAEIKNLKKVAERILKAVRNKEKIILYGDTDPDGATSVIILKETIEILGGKVSQVCFPDREKEGYGLNKSALKFLRKNSPALLITLDCGISNVEEVDLAKKMGFEVIIIDHHEMLPKIPKASIIVDPKQKGDQYPFKYLANVGITYNLSKFLLIKEKKWDFPERFLDLVALATIADMVLLEGENKELVEEGLLALISTGRTSLKVLIELTDFELEDGIAGIRQKILPPLSNPFSQKNHLGEIYLFLIEEDIEKAEKLAKKLIKESQERREEKKRISKELMERIESQTKKEPIIFEGDSSWSLILLGPVASMVCQKYKKPTFLFKERKEESPGTVRMPQGFDGVKAMINCQKFLETYGGHPLAAGFRVKTQNLENFKKCLIKYFKKNEKVDNLW